MLDTLAVANYRSLRRLVVPLGRCTIVTGANGSGKSSLYRSLRLLADMARNGAVSALAREGGLASTMWPAPAVPARSASGLGSPAMNSAMPSTSACRGRQHRLRA